MPKKKESSKKEVRRIEYRPHPDSEKAKLGEKVKAEFLDFKIIREDWNIYELEDGTRVRIRVSSRGFVKPLDPKTEEVIYRKEHPIYGVDFRVETSFEYPEKLLRP